MEKREEYIDAIAGLMILWMIVGHSQQIAGHEFGYPNILFFFMPWFYYKSGMLSKPKVLREQAKGGERKFFKLFVIYGLIGQVILTICMLLEHEHSLKQYIYSPIRGLFLGGTVSGNPPLWFLTSLFVTLCAYAWLNEKKVHIGIIATLGLVCAFICNRVNSYLFPVYLSSGLYGLFFFSMGKILYKYQKNWILFVVSAVVVAGGGIWHGLPDVGLRYIAQCGGTVLDFVVWTMMALGGCVIVTYIFSLVQPYVKLPVLQYIGRNAMEFYVLHWIVMIVVMRLIMGDLFGCWNPYILMAAGLIACAVIVLSIVYVKKQIKNNE